MKHGFTPSLLDKLCYKNRDAAAENTVVRFSMDEIKDAVARDLESLLNTRKVISDQEMQAYPESMRSIASYGLNDFAGLSLSSLDDCAFICRSIEATIGNHEPRLKNVRAKLELHDGSVNRLNFAISALLVLYPLQEPVNFDAVLQPSSLQYSISKSRRATNLVH